jgi:hypothetical protein
MPGGQSNGLLTGSPPKRLNCPSTHLSCIVKTKLAGALRASPIPFKELSHNVDPVPQTLLWKGLNDRRDHPSSVQPYVRSTHRRMRNTPSNSPQQPMDQLRVTPYVVVG